MARVVLVRSARAQLIALADQVADAVLDAITLLEGDAKAGRALRGRLRGLRAVRLGSYRLIYDLVDRGKTVRVLAIWHREAAYRRDPRRKLRTEHALHVCPAEIRPRAAAVSRAGKLESR